MTVVLTAPDFVRAREQSAPEHGQHARGVDWTSPTMGQHHAAEHVATDSESSDQAAASSSATPGYAGPAYSINASGRLCEERLPDSERSFTIFMHLSPLAFIWVGPFALAIPLVMWLVRKDQSRFIDDHGREIVNFMIGLAILHIVTAITIIGFIAWPVLWVVAVVGVIRGSMAAGRSEYFRYPMTVRLLN